MVLVYLFLACETKTDFDKIDYFVQEISPSTNLSNYTVLVALNETGTCINCNFAFAKTMSMFIDSSEVLFLVSSRGGQIDISEYLKKADHDNVIFDYENNFSELNLVDHCAIIHFADQAIDTIIQIELGNLEKSVDHFTLKL